MAHHEKARRRHVVSAMPDQPGGREALFISGRTVESHIHHIKSKLGLSQRVRIVAWALGRDSRDES
jgi:hypothetical protein